MNPRDFLDVLKRRVGLSSYHEATLQGLSRTMSPIGMEVALAFYDYLGRDQEMKELIWAVPDRVERLCRTFAAWYAELFSGSYDLAYAHRRYRIGLVHARLGVGPRHMIPAMGHRAGAVARAHERGVQDVRGARGGRGIRKDCRN